MPLQQYFHKYFLGYFTPNLTGFLWMFHPDFKWWFSSSGSSWCYCSSCYWISPVRGFKLSKLCRNLFFYFFAKFPALSKSCRINNKNRQIVGFEIESGVKKDWRKKEITTEGNLKGDETKLQSLLVNSSVCVCICICVCVSFAFCVCICICICICVCISKILKASISGQFWMVL